MREAAVGLDGSRSRPGLCLHSGPPRLSSLFSSQTDLSKGKSHHVTPHFITSVELHYPQPQPLSLCPGHLFSLISCLFTSFPACQVLVINIIIISILCTICFHSNDLKVHNVKDNVHIYAPSPPTPAT